MIEGIFSSIEAYIDVFSRFKNDPDDDFIDVNRLTLVLQAFGRNPSMRDAELRIQELQASGKSKEKKHIHDILTGSILIISYFWLLSVITELLTIFH